MTNERIIEEIYTKGYDDGWYAFVEGFDFPDAIDENILIEKYNVTMEEAILLNDQAYYEGLMAGWEDADQTQLPVPEFVENETSEYFDQI